MLTPPELLGWIKLATGCGGVKVIVSGGRAAVATSHGTWYDPSDCFCALGAAEKYSSTVAEGRRILVVPVSAENYISVNI